MEEKSLEEKSLVENETDGEECHSNTTNYDRYQIYCRCVKDLGWYCKSFDEWLDS